jgi:pyruvate/2-oxoglutarate dehydrogenase complex dihydrolipoamide dehydrogenase (E3) component
MITATRDADHSVDALTRPLTWRNPHPQSRYDVVVIGGGTAGLVTAMGGAALGARVALIERARLGGECLHTGCVPSKGLLRTARAVGDLRTAARVGVHAVVGGVDFDAAMRRMTQARADLARHDAADRVVRAGIDLFFGEARFTDSRTVGVAGEHLRFRRAVIATGSRPAVPPIAGLAGVSFLTNETVFELPTRPAHLIVIGGGPVGCELAQAFARFGSRVTVIEHGHRLLPHDDPDAATIVQEALAADGVEIAIDRRIDRISQRNGHIVVLVTRGSATNGEEFVGDRLLVAAGRAANVESLDLGAAGIAVGSNGVVTDDFLQTTNRRVLAAGDVCGRLQFTHAADAMARIVVQNALFPVRRKASRLTIPWCTYTDPEVAHVGIGPEPASRARQVQTLTVPFAEIDRAIIDEDPRGFIRVHHRGGRLLGCTIVGTSAGELIAYASDGVARHATLTAWASAIVPYPTRADVFRKAGDAYRRERLTPGIRRWLERYFRFTRW